MKTGKARLIILIGCAAVCFISTVYAGSKTNAKKKSGKLLPESEYCTQDAECESKHCCQRTGRMARYKNKSCHHNCTELTRSDRAKAPDCANGTYKGDTYIYCAEPKINWFTAFQKCCEMNGSLPVADTVEYINFMQELVFKTKYKGGWPWTAGTNFLTGHNTEYVWYLKKSRIPIKLSSFEIDFTDNHSCVRSAKNRETAKISQVECDEYHGLACKLN